MSSPPTPTTSIRVAPLFTRKQRERSASFPSIASINPFRRKHAPQPPALIEPYEVAPGILSTDATAQVFGYLDADEKQTSKARSQSAGSDKRNRSQTPTLKRKPIPAKGLLNRLKEAHRDDGTDDFTTSAHRRHVEAWDRSRQEKRDEARREREESQRRGRRGRMRTVSRDDELVERGANPRTGLVSPCITSEDSGGNIENDYIAVRRVPVPRPSARRAGSSGRWKQDSQGWSLVDGPLLSPIAQSTSDKPSREVSVKMLQDKLLAEMPGVDNPEPDNLTPEQIRRYQESIERAERYGGGSHAVVDPDTLPSPRNWTPEGPSTPPGKLQKIQRKKVGSSLSPGGISSDTMIINGQTRAASLPTPRNDIRESQRVRITTPSAMAEGKSPRIALDLEDPFLGPRSQVCQTASGTHFLSPPKARQGAHHRRPLEERNPPGAPSAHRPNFPNLNQYLPSLQFPHPSRFADLAAASYRRPAQLLPARLRPLDQKRRIVEDASITIPTIISKQETKKEQRPRIQRLGGSTIVPRASPELLVNPVTRKIHGQGGPPLEERRGGSIGGPREKPQPPQNPMARRHQPQGILPRDERQGGSVAGPRASPQPPRGLITQNSSSEDVSPPARLTVDTSDSTVRKSQHIQSCERQGDPEGDVTSAEHAARAAMLGDNCIQRSAELRPRERSGQVPTTEGLRLGSANVVREPVRRNRDGDGCTPMSGRHGNDPNSALKAKPVVDLRGNEHSSPIELAVDGGGNGHGWFAGQWAVQSSIDETPDSATMKREETLARRRSVLRKAADMKLWLFAVEGWLHASAKWEYILQRLKDMVCHIHSTLHHASPAITVLRTPNVRAQDYLIAAKDIALAAVYLLILLNIFMVVRRVLLMVSKVVCVMWHPLRLGFVVLRWCVVG